MNGPQNPNRLLWQHPFVNVFKQFKVENWKKASKEGDVTSVMDKHLKCTVFKIQGSIPAGNFIQLPRTSTQSLGLTGRFLYFMFKPLPAKYFVIHVDTVSEDGLVVRISFSNLFKEFKSTSTWLQFPFACQPAKGSVEHCAAVGAKTNFMGPAPVAQKWTTLVLDLHYILSMYINRKFSHLKNIRICANVLIKNCFTSDISYDPRISIIQARKMGITSVDENSAPMPREMNFFVPKNKEWDDCYDIVRFPLDSPADPSLPFDSIRRKTKRSNAAPGVISSPERKETKNYDITKDTGSYHDNLAVATRVRRTRDKVKVASELPTVGLSMLETSNTSCSDPNITMVESAKGDIHVFADKPDIVVHRHYSSSTGKPSVASTDLKLMKTTFEGKANQSSSLQPDPILKLRRVIGFGGQSSSFITSHRNDIIVYACNSVVVAMETATGHQHFFIGHTESVTAIAFNQMHGAAPCILASAQSGAGGIVRIWRFESQKCAAVIRSQHATKMNLLSFSRSGAILVGVGRDGHGKNLIIVWDTSGALRHGSVTVIAKAHSDVEIHRIEVCPVDDTRMVSCGRDNLRFWRVRSNQLRSCPVAVPTDRKIGEFSDVTFARAGNCSELVEEETSVFTCTKAGYIVEVDFHKVTITSIHRLFPSNNTSTDDSTMIDFTGLSLNTVRFTDSYVATGSDDGFLRLWPLDLSSAFIEAEHEGSVSDIDITPDGVKVLASTTAGTIGYLDVATRKYSTLMRSHTSVIRDTCIDGLRRTISTCSDDHTIRVWDIDTLRQFYDFATVDETPTALACHPLLEIFACGFETGTVRVFHVSSTSVLSEHPQVHSGSKVAAIVFTASGERLISACEKGTLALFDTSDIEKAGAPMIRILTKTAARGAYGPRSIATSHDGRWVAYIGPNEFTISIASSATLNQVMRIDVSTGVKLDPDILGQRSKIDPPLRVLFSPPPVNHLLVVTKGNRLLKLDSKTGSLISVTENIHRGNTNVVCVTDDCSHLVSAGDKLIKVWDYKMSKDLDHQAFIGHSSPVHRIMFTPDRLSLITASEGAIFIWDFLGNSHTPIAPVTMDTTHVIGLGRSVKEGLLMSARKSEDEMCVCGGSEEEPEPRESPPAPTAPTREKVTHKNGILSQKNERNTMTQQNEDAGIPSSIDRDAAPTEDEEVDGVPVKRAWGSLRSTSGAVEEEEEVLISCDPPSVVSHFVPTTNYTQLASRTYTAPSGEEGLKLKAVVGYNGNGRHNLCWNPYTGTLAYSCGNVVVIEILQTSEKQYLLEHEEEISCLAIQHDGEILASASGSNGLVQSIICLWDINTGVCRAKLKHHEYSVVSMAYSRDDRFLVTVGDYQENSLAVWSAFDGESPPMLLASTKTNHSINQVTWDPSNPNEFVTVGSSSSLLFWMLEEVGEQVKLHLHEGEVPDAIEKDGNKKKIHFTAACFNEDRTLYAGTNIGVVTAWDTTTNECFLHWRADSAEIVVMQARAWRLLVAGVSRSARIWSLAGSKDPTNESGGMFVLEHELSVHGEIISGSFDESLDIGIVGTTSSTVWYMDWNERSTIKLVSGHKDKINGISFDNNGHFATCSEDGVVQLWSEHTLEMAAQFQVLGQSCTSVVFSHSSATQTVGPPNMVAAGYSDGTIRVFDIDKLILKLKLQPHPTVVTSLQFSSDNNTLLSGASDGTIAVTSLATGVTLRVLRDHKGAPINNISVSARELTKNSPSGENHSPRLSLFCSADRRVSVWDTEWQHDVCNMIDWLTFPAPCFAPDGTKLNLDDKNHHKFVPPSFCKFHPTDPDLLVYCGYGLTKSLQLYSLAKRKVVKTIPLPNWADCFDLHGQLCVVGTSSRLVELVDVTHGTFQDYVGHGRDVTQAAFSPSGKLLLTASGGELFVWDVCVG
uniref:WD repeat-containing protein 90 n=1 Tax=Ciona intestinalis TaxID=7719 RepID=F7AB73_CIOIN